MGGFEEQILLHITIAFSVLGFGVGIIFLDRPLPFLVYKVAGVTLILASPWPLALSLGGLTSPSLASASVLIGVLASLILERKLPER